MKVYFESNHEKVFHDKSSITITNSKIQNNISNYKWILENDTNSALYYLRL